MPLGKELNVLTDTIKDQYKFFEDQINVNNNHRKDDIKKKDIETDNVDHDYIGEEYKNLIDKIF